jgi:tetratricopeptide (TPR) repeat protein
VLAAWLAASVAFAAEPTTTGGSPSGRTETAEVPPVARQRYTDALRAYKEGRYKDAIDLFIEADRLAPSAALSFNVARAYERIGDSTSALAWYRDYLRRAGDAKDRSEVEAIVKDLAKRLQAKGVQQMTVLSEPPGATVHIDDRPVGVTAWTGELAPGRHRVSLRLRGFRDAESVVDLNREEPLDVTVPLVAEPEDEPQAQSAPPPDATVLPESPYAPAVVRDEPRPAEGGVRPLTWIALGAGAASLGAAGIFELMRHSAADDAAADRTQIGRAEKLETADGHMTTARVLAAVGGGLVVIGGVLLIVDLGRGSSPAQVAVGAGCPSGGCGIVGRAAF